MANHGMISCYVTFDGNAAEAARYYSGIFGVPANIMFYKDYPDHGMGEVDPEAVMHADLRFDSNSSLMLSDNVDELHRGDDFSWIWSHEDGNTVRGVWQKFVESGAEILEPLQHSFWAPLYGSVRDPFGVSWLIMQDEPAAE